MNPNDCERFKKVDDNGGEQSKRFNPLVCL